MDWDVARQRCQPQPGESLGQKQERHARMAAYLILWADEQGYRVRGGDWFRDPRVHGEYGEKASYASAVSLHKLKLAIDLNLTKDGQYLASTTDHAPLGEFWKSLAPDAQWGGEGSRNDGNHYSLGHDGNW